MNYYRKIDGLRAIAVLMVIMSHWIPKSSRLIPFGEIGVDIFFVISGFLITHILLTEKEKALQERKGLQLVLKNFILRRALRIFPIYYLSLFTFWLLQDYEGYHLRENLIYYVGYCSNILFFLNNAWDGYLAPLWSLAVEEQFYLIWPLLLIFIDRKYTLIVIVISIIIGLVFPYFFERDMTKVLTPSCMNVLGAGALLAWLNIHKNDFLVKYRRAFLLAGILFLFFTVLIILVFGFQPFHVLVRAMISVQSVVLILYCLGIIKPLRLVEWVFNNSTLVFVGKISYGLYLYHNLVSIISKHFINKYFVLLTNGIDNAFSNGAWLILKFVILIGVSWISYQYIERPFLGMKKHFVLD